jgi:hypothetical protein
MFMTSFMVASRKRLGSHERRADRLRRIPETCHFSPRADFAEIWLRVRAHGDLLRGALGLSPFPDQLPALEHRVMAEDWTFDDFSDADVRKALIEAMREDGGTAFRAMLQKCIENGDRKLYERLINIPELRDLVPH